MTRQPGWRVVVCDSGCRTLSGRLEVRYASPAHTEPSARRLIAVLAGVSDGPGPWQRPITGGRRTITLELIP